MTDFIPHRPRIQRQRRPARAGDGRWTKIFRRGFDHELGDGHCAFVCAHACTCPVLVVERGRGQWRARGRRGRRGVESSVEPVDYQVNFLFRIGASLSCQYRGQRIYRRPSAPRSSPRCDPIDCPVPQTGSRGRREGKRNEHSLTPPSPPSTPSLDHPNYSPRSVSLPTAALADSLCLSTRVRRLPGLFDSARADYAHSPLPDQLVLPTYILSSCRAKSCGQRATHQQSSSVLPPRPSVP